MWIDEHPYLSIYLLGCALAFILTLFKVALVWIINWITKANIFYENLKKVQPPDTDSFENKALKFIGILLAETSISWINVIVVLWQIASIVLRALREFFSSTPETIKLLRFPLHNNLDMSRESVWAYLCAIGLKAGANQPNENEILTGLNEAAGYYPSFDRVAALKQLENLNVVNGDIISSTLKRLSSTEVLSSKSFEDE